MPGSTPLYSLPYPLTSDAVAGLDETFRALVDRLELVLAAASQPPLTPSDFASTVAAIAAFNAAPVLVTPTPFAASAGWGIAGSLFAWQKVRLASIAITNNTGAAIAASATGVLTGTPTVCTVGAGHRPPATATGPWQGNNGFSRIDSAGNVKIIGYPPSLSIGIGAVVTASLVYLIA